MNNDYYLGNVKDKIKTTSDLIEFAEISSKFYTSPGVTRSLVKIEEHLDEIEVEAKKMIKLVF